MNDQTLTGHWVGDVFILVFGIPAFSYLFAVVACTFQVCK